MSLFKVLLLVLALVGAALAGTTPVCGDGLANYCNCTVVFLPIAEPLRLRQNVWSLLVGPDCSRKPTPYGNRLGAVDTDFLRHAFSFSLE